MQIVERVYRDAMEGVYRVVRDVLGCHWRKKNETSSSL